MLAIAIGVLTTMLGVGFGCMVLELTMRALGHRLGGITDTAYERLTASVSVETRGAIAARTNRIKEV